MAVGQLPDHVREFARYLRDLLTRLDSGAGWCGVFWSRDPDGMQACLDGAEVPPWDVMEALLHDLAAGYGERAAEQETQRARTLHAASLAAYDARPGGRQLLGERLDMMLTEQRYAVERQAELGRSLAVAATPDEVERLNRDLAWVRDDHERATARCAELRERIERLERADRPQWVDLGTPDAGVSSYGVGVPAEEYAESSEYAPEQPRVPEQAAVPRRRPRGARFAGFDGFDEDVADPVVVPETAEPQSAGRTPRGARYAHADDGPREPAPGDVDSDTGSVFIGPDRDADRATADAVAALVRLRGEGRSGEAHGVLVEAAGWPAARLPAFAGELHRAGLGADWSTLLWEAASLPPDRLVALADALAGSGRADDCRKLLRQGVARPAPEIAEAVLALIDAGREREARALLDAYLRVRTAEDAAGCAHTDPHRLIPLLLKAAQGVSDEHHWDLVHALRVAGFSA
ncbi:hypothetical protein [Streptomyces sp. MZ04]|uniref:hypothetical protein n=1 Tax=Streptomyces sp. MZ04 TaxID=2559236 RepID=UPI00107E8A4F|nr:hypothetical protein [Streptomyces sp. MZ04]TGB14907.1 hypothetical protein E2651_04290 [Streptomyces sp. MZ04]